MAIASIRDTSYRNCTKMSIRVMSLKAIYRQHVPGDLPEEKAFAFECSHIFLVDQKKMFKDDSCATTVLQ